MLTQCYQQRAVAAAVAVSVAAAVTVDYKLKFVASFCLFVCRKTWHAVTNLELDRQSRLFYV